MIVESLFSYVDFFWAVASCHAVMFPANKHQLHLTLCSWWWLRLEATSWDADCAHSLNQVGHVSCTPLSPCGLGGILFWFALCFLDLFGFLLQFLKKTQDTPQICYCLYHKSIILSTRCRTVFCICGLYS